MSQSIANSFEKGFMSVSLAKQISDCETYELAPLFLELFQKSQPVLEAGCGSGRWCGWFAKHGIRSDGIDWSKELCERASRDIPFSRFVACDMTCTPLADNSYGGLIALGSVEHASAGPQAALKEFLRVMRSGGVAVITVPYGGPLRRFLRKLAWPMALLKASIVVRRMAGMPYSGRSLKAARINTTKAWYPRFAYGEHGWSFYEYEFNKEQMRQFLDSAGFEVVSESVRFGDEGIFHNFGRLTGRWDNAKSCIVFSPLGRVLRRLLPVEHMGHMLCYIARKPDGTKPRAIPPQ